MPDAGGPPYALTNFPNGLITSAIFLRDGLITTGDPENPEDPVTPIILDGPILFPHGEINELGEMGLGTTPPPGLYPIGTIHPEGTGWGPDELEALFRIGGVYGPTTSPVIFNIQNIYRPGPVMLPHFSNDINLFAVIPYLEPLLPTINRLVGIVVNPNLTNSATDITTMVGTSIGWNVLPAYTGTISNIVGLQVGGVNNQGTDKYIASVRGISIGGLGTNQNIVAGKTAVQHGIIIGAIVSAANGGTLNNYGIEIQVPSSAATLGIANNRGLYITGNGGTATGGTVSNYAIYSTSTAPSLFTGPVIQMPAASVTPANNGEMMVQLTSNTQLTIKVKGSDGTVRSTNLTFSLGTLEMHQLTHVPNGVMTSIVVMTGDQATMGIGSYPPPYQYPMNGLHPAGTGWGPDLPEAQLRLGGVFGPTTAPVLLNIQNIYRPGPVMLPHFSGGVNLLAVIPFIEPLITTTLEYLVGVSCHPTLNNSTTNIAQLTGLSAGYTVRPTYTGVISSYTGVNVGGIAGVNAVPVKIIPQFRGIWVQSLGPNNNITTGICNQHGIYVGTVVSAANGGTNNNCGIEIQVPSGVAALGTVNNHGLTISGNGGTATGGTVSNYAIRCTSTAPSLFTGPIIQMPPASVTPVNNGEMMVEATSNTQLTIKFKGTDGTVRSTSLTLT